MVAFEPEANLNLEQRKQRVKLAKRVLAVENGIVPKLTNLAMNDVPRSTAYRVLEEAVENNTVEKVTYAGESGKEHTTYAPDDRERLERFVEQQKITPEELGISDEPSSSESTESTVICGSCGENIKKSEIRTHDCG